VFFEILGDSLSVAYRLVPARLQYGCSRLAHCLTVTAWFVATLDSC
jgi:hypothetical protein